MWQDVPGLAVEFLEEGKDNSAIGAHLYYLYVESDIIEAAQVEIERQHIDYNPKWTPKDEKSLISISSLHGIGNLHAVISSRALPSKTKVQTSSKWQEMTGMQELQVLAGITLPRR